MKATAIIQARMGSTRLPEKVLMEIEGKPMLWHIVRRTITAKSIDDVVIATSDNPRDDRIAKFAIKYKFNIFRGSENDCLDRYYKAAKAYSSDTVVRITGDCPLICPDVIDDVLAAYSGNRYDYATNTLCYTYPEGCDVEVFSFKALEKAWQECKDPVGREHVTPYIKDSGKFEIVNVESKHPVDPNEYRWSVDRVNDLEFVRNVYKHLYKGGKIFRMKDVIKLLKKKPHIKSINMGTVANEGYYKSIMKTPKIKAKKISVKRSLRLKKKTERLIPGCSQTFSKGPTQFVQGVAPVFLEKGKGCRVWDIDGNEYIDYAMALGPVILGHNYHAVNDAVMKIMAKGITFTLPHRFETELSEKLCDLIPCAEMVRLGKNGSDVTSAAVRVARAYTGRDIIACCGYHGWQDWYIATTTMNDGIPGAIRKLTKTFEYNKIATLEKLFRENRDRIACVMMEPIGVVEPKDDFLNKVKQLTRENGALLIFDEIVTGFRVSMGGAQEYYNVVPDLGCFGKGMANGLPIAALVGKRKIMKLFKNVFYSFTFGGEIVSIAAALATINEMGKRNVIRHLWEQGCKIRDGYNVLAKEYGLEKYTQCIGLPPRTVVTFTNKKGETDLQLKSLFQQECVKRGVLFTAGHNICFSHSNKDVDYTLRVYRTVFEIVKDAIGKDKVKRLIEGDVIQPVFRKP